MATVTVRPTATVDLGDATVTGAATAHEALSDDSDASYVSIGALAEGDGVTVTLADPTIPAGAVVTSMRLRVRANSTAGQQSQLRARLESGQSGTTIVNWANVNQAVLIQAAIDADPESLDVTLENVTGDCHVHEVFLDVTYVAQPTVTVTGPSGTITDNDTPTITWEMS